jgi:hypothetical protein
MSDLTNDAEESSGVSESPPFKKYLSPTGEDVLPIVYKEAGFVSYDDAQKVQIASSSAYRSGAYLCEKSPKPISKCLAPQQPIRG